MATMNNSGPTWMSHYMQTNFRAFCVKSRKRGRERITGRLVSPDLAGKKICNDDELYAALAKCRKVVVISHDTLDRSKLFTWTGTGREFKAEWQGD